MSGMRIDEFFAANPTVAVALSGGLGSAYLLFAAAAVRADVRAYCMACPGADERELRTALRLAKLLGVPFRLLEPEPGTAAGARGILRLIRERAASDGCPQVLAGVDADAPEGSHWLRACSELGVLTPLRLCGIHAMHLQQIKSCPPDVLDQRSLRRDRHGYFSYTFI